METLRVMETILMISSVLCLIGSVAPILSGEVRVRWLTTGMTSSVMLALMGVIVSAINPGVEVEASANAATETGLGAAVFRIMAWVIGGTIVIPIILKAAGCVVGHIADRRSHRSAVVVARRAMKDPIRVAQAHAPGMLADVRVAMERIDRIRTIGRTPAGVEDADALMLAERRLPSLMARYALAVDAIDDGVERSALARSTLEAVIQIGVSADEARRRMAEGLRNDLDAEMRYISTRTQTSGLNID